MNHDPDTYWTRQGVRRGTCRTHGSVNAVKNEPRPHFPYLIYGVRKLRTVFQPYHCPACGTQVKTKQAR